MSKLSVIPGRKNAHNVYRTQLGLDAKVHGHLFCLVSKLYKRRTGAMRATIIATAVRAATKQ